MVVLLASCGRNTNSALINPASDNHPVDMTYVIEDLGSGTILITGRYFDSWSGRYYFDGLKAGLQEAVKRHNVKNCTSINFSHGYAAPTGALLCFYEQKK
jgi:hypothetical protein